MTGMPGFLTKGCKVNIKAFGKSYSASCYARILGVIVIKVFSNVQTNFFYGRYQICWTREMQY